MVRAQPTGRQRALAHNWDKSMSNAKSPKRAKATRNLLLSHMPPGDFGLIEEHLTEIELPLRMNLERRNKRIEFV